MPCFFNKPKDQGHPHSGAPTDSEDQRKTFGVHPTLSDIIAWFKTMTTNAYIRGVKENGWMKFERHLWQRNYYEHVIRNENDLNPARQYILNNPLK